MSAQNTSETPKDGGPGKNALGTQEASNTGGGQPRTEQVKPTPLRGPHKRSMRLQQGATQRKKTNNAQPTAEPHTRGTFYNDHIWEQASTPARSFAPH